MIDPRGKLDTPVTVRIDDDLRDALDREQRSRERESGVPLSRAATLRILVEERLGLRARPSAGS